ncbi:hypothetical protein FHG87_023689 [Trinorchestia longiramus]|nr:hypothetical protein FHG87_023689 [Trinorchestia longiramus]
MAQLLAQQLVQPFTQQLVQLLTQQLVQLLTQQLVQLVRCKQVVQLPTQQLVQLVRCKQVVQLVSQLEQTSLTPQQLVVCTPCLCPQCRLHLRQVDTVRPNACPLWSVVDGSVVVSGQEWTAIQRQVQQLSAHSSSCSTCPSLYSKVAELQEAVQEKEALQEKLQEALQQKEVLQKAVERQAVELEMEEAYRSNMNEKWLEQVEQYQLKVRSRWSSTS